MNHASLLIELFTEELPPKVLERLGQAFAQGIASGLSDKMLLSADSVVTAFATPRRLAVRITGVADVAPDQPFYEKLMPAKIGLDENRKPTAALQKKLASKGLAHLQTDDLEEVMMANRPTWLPREWHPALVWRNRSNRSSKQPLPSCQSPRLCSISSTMA